MKLLRGAIEIDYIAIFSGLLYPLSKVRHRANTHQVTGCQYFTNEEKSVGHIKRPI